MSFSLAIIALLSALSMGLFATVVIEHRNKRRLMCVVADMRERFRTIERDVEASHRAARLAGLDTTPLASNLASIARIREHSWDKT